VEEADALDLELVERFVKGDEEALVSLYRRWQMPVQRFALAMTGSPHAAEDVMQETFVVLIREGARYDPRRGPVSAYLRGVARHLVLRRIRRDSRFVAFADGLADALESVQGRDAPRSPDPAETLIRREEEQAVQAALLRLSPRLREVLVLCDLDDLSYAEAAAVLAVPIGTVRSRLSRAREALARRLERQQAHAVRALARVEP